jgi:predicted chitinase
MGAADAAGAGDAGNELLPVAAVGDVDGLEAPGANLDAAGVWRAGELCALADVNGASASITQAINGMVNFITTLSFLG